MAQLCEAALRSGLFRLLLVPIHSAAKSFFEADQRNVAESFARGSNIGLRILYIAGSLGTVGWRFGIAGQLCENLVSLIQCVALAAGNIEDLSCDFFPVLEERADWRIRRSPHR